MKISIVLPTIVKIPMGGVKIVSAYANEFAKAGHNVVLYYPKTISGSYLKQRVITFVKPLIDNLQSIPGELYYQGDSTNVKHLIVQGIDDKHLSIADVVIATGWQTAKPVADLPIKCGNKFYFIQHWEPLFGNKTIIENTYHLPLKKIVIAKWLKQKLQDINESVISTIPNWILPDEFYQTNNSENRDNVISFIYHHNKIKGGKDGLKILISIKKRNPQIKIIVISTRPIYGYKRMFDIRIRPNTEQVREIFNKSSVFLHTSYHEGWGLPPMEASACGAVVVGYKNLGISEFLNEKTALLSQVGDIDSVIKDIFYILGNKKKRTNLVLNAQKKISKFSVEKSTNKFLNVLNGDVL